MERQKADVTRPNGRAQVEAEAPSDGRRESWKDGARQLPGFGALGTARVGNVRRGRSPLGTRNKRHDPRGSDEVPGAAFHLPDVPFAAGAAKESQAGSAVQFTASGCSPSARFGPATAHSGLGCSTQTAWREQGARANERREEEEWAASRGVRTRRAGSSTRAPSKALVCRPNDYPSSRVPEGASPPAGAADASLAILESSASSAMTSRGRSSTKRHPPWNCSTRYSWNCTKRLSASRRAESFALSGICGVCANQSFTQTANASM